MERIVEIKDGKLVVTCFNPLTVDLRDITLKINEMGLVRKGRQRQKRRRRRRHRRRKKNLLESRTEKKSENKNEFRYEHHLVKKEMKREII